uniref:RING-type domain-containing protein n=1 Tax=Timema monikensis TaxID=170555 RepID=A0A7R9HJ10_9NEOP|nr:unnamed protein product [Timema monikensis]
MVRWARTHCLVQNSTSSTSLHSEHIYSTKVVTTMLPTNRPDRRKSGPSRLGARKRNQKTSSQNVYSCSICQDTLNNVGFRLLPCTHSFHGTCIDRWFEMSLSSYRSSSSRIFSSQSSVALVSIAAFSLASFLNTRPWYCFKQETQPRNGYAPFAAAMFKVERPLETMAT